MQFTYKIKTGIKNLSFLLPLVIVSPYLQAEVIYEAALSGKEFQMGNLLTWTTAEEANSGLFSIERSLDGDVFDAIGSIEAAGNALKTTNYNFLDINISDKKAFYRLRQTDTDGTVSYSHTIQVLKQWSNQFAVLTMNSTEVNKQFKCTIESRTAGKMTYALFNYDETLVFEDELSLINGLNDLSIPMEGRSEGIYKIRLMMADEVEQLTIQKLNDKTKYNMKAVLKIGKRGG